MCCSAMDVLTEQYRGLTTLPLFWLVFETFFVTHAVYSIKKPIKPLEANLKKPEVLKRRFLLYFFLNVDTSYESSGGPGDMEVDIG